jgi:predicted MFS family arabinose efflux permease
MAPATPPAAAGPSQVVKVVAITLGSQTVVSMGSATMPMIAPRLAEDFGIDPALIGLQVAIAYGAAAIGALFGGGLVRRLGPCRATQLSLLMTALGIATATLPSLVALAAASVLIGSAIGLVSPPAAQLIVRFAPASQFNLVFSLKQTGVPLGFMLTALTAPIVTLTLGWRWSLALVGTLAIAGILLLQRRREVWDVERTRDAPLLDSPLAGIRAVWSRPRVRWLVLCGSCYSAVQVCVVTFTVTMLVREGGFGLVQAGLMMSIANVAGVVGRISWGWVADRWSAGQGVLIAVGTIMGTCCVLIGMMEYTWPPFAIQCVFVAFGASAIGWNGILHAEVARLTPPALTGLTSSGTLFFVFGAICLMPAGATAVYRLLGSYALLFSTLTVFAALGVALVVLARRSSAGPDATV